MTLTLTAKLSQSQGMLAADNKTLAQPMGRNTGPDTKSVSRRPSDDQEQIQPIVDLVCVSP
jgi:hypothetical protein